MESLPPLLPLPRSLLHLSPCRFDALDPFALHPSSSSSSSSTTTTTTTTASSTAFATPLAAATATATAPAAGQQPSPFAHPALPRHASSTPRPRTSNVPRGFRSLQHMEVCHSMQEWSVSHVWQPCPYTGMCLVQFTFTSRRVELATGLVDTSVVEGHFELTHDELMEVMRCAHESADPTAAAPKYELLLVPEEFGNGFGASFDTPPPVASDVEMDAGREEDQHAAAAPPPPPPPPPFYSQYAHARPPAGAANDAAVALGETSTATMAVDGRVGDDGPAFAAAALPRSAVYAAPCPAPCCNSHKACR